jgi:Cys-rich protein (TIGR01571 family)
MPKIIRVVAPADLDASFRFDVELDGRPFTVTVPAGGVKEGEEFDIPYPGQEPEDDDDDDDESYYEKEEDEDSRDRDDATMPVQSGSEEEPETDELGAPYGHWRYSLCACCDVVTQATFWMAFCCTPIAIAQLLTRMQLNWRGFVDSESELSLSFNKIIITFIAVLVVGNIPVVGFFIICLYGFAVMVVIGRRIRKNMRERYRIPPSLGSRFESVDDCCCMTLCGWCSLIQMARHTHNDKEWPGSCCTVTGLDIEAPKII